MKININVDEIEFEGGSRTGSEFNFHEQIRIRKAFERELSRLLSGTTIETRNSFIERMLQNKFFNSQNSDKINFVKEIEGGEYSLPVGNKDPSLIGKGLAESIYSALNLVDGSTKAYHKSTTTTTKNNKKR